MESNDLKEKVLDFSVKCDVVENLGALNWLGCVSLEPLKCTRTEILMFLVCKPLD